MLNFRLDPFYFIAIPFNFGTKKNGVWINFSVSISFHTCFKCSVPSLYPFRTIADCATFYIHHLPVTFYSVVRTTRQSSRNFGGNLSILLMPSLCPFTFVSPFLKFFFWSLPWQLRCYISFMFFFIFEEEWNCLK